MSKLRLVFVISLVILGTLVMFTVFRPMASAQRFSEVCRESIIQREDEWIIQFDIINKEGRDINYIINWYTGGEIYNSKTVSIKAGRTFTNIQHLYPETVKEGKVSLSIWKGLATYISIKPLILLTSC